jgi:glycosyltransferase involved in cell wall biosynthesis
VGLATSGRFHLLDLGRELDAQGIDVRFYSYVPRKRAEQFGLPRRCHVALLPFLFPFVVWERLFPRILPQVIERLMCWLQDALVVMRLRRCDVFVCMSGMYVMAPTIAKRRYGAKVIVYRASTHILAQKQVLEHFPDARQVTPFMIQRELRGYDVADQIGVPSSHVVESFAPWPEHARKLAQNPYGVDIEQFPLRDSVNMPDRPTILFVGHWSYRKGVDILVQAIDAMEGVRLVHVGALLDAPFPTDSRYTHHDYVPQWKLKEFYAAAHVFALASREDGLAYVLPQALASGLPVVCTDRTGGADLARLRGLSRLIHVVPAGDVVALRGALARALDGATGKTPFTPITEAEREMLSWRRYASRELQSMAKLVATTRDHAS